MQIIISKYLQQLSLSCWPLLPTLVYYYSVVRLGNPIGNIDKGATWGSYIGLFMLAGVYAAIESFVPP